MTTRRKFIQNTIAGTAGLALINPLNLIASGQTRQIKNLGYITGLIGKELDGNWKKILKQTAEMGYTEIETGNFMGKSAKKFLKYCDSIGLTPIAGHLAYTNDMDKIQENLDRLLALKMKYAINYWPWQGGPPFNLEKCKVSAEWLNKVGSMVSERGLKFCWHNHDNEFFEMEAGKPFDFLMENTDPEHVFCELDVHWVHRGGSHPVDVMKQYAGRIPILHLKDMDFNAAKEESFRCPGEGDVDFKAILAEAHIQGINHYFVERDKHPNGMQCLQISADHLLNLKF